MKKDMIIKHKLKSIQVKLLFYLGLFLLATLSLTLNSSNCMALDLSKPLTLEECIRYAQENSPSTKISKNVYKSRKARYDAFTADYYPKVSLYGSIPGLTRSLNPISQNDGTVQYRYQNMLSSTATLAITQKVPFTGGLFEVYSGLARTDILGDNQTSTWRTIPISVSFTQPLFKINTMGWDMEIEGLRFENIKKQFSEEMEDIAIDVTDKFFNVYIQSMNVKNSELNVALNDTLYKLSINRFKVGKIAENDLLQSELALLNGRNSLDESRLAYQRAQEEFRIFLGIETTAVEIKVAPPERVPTVIVDPNKAFTIAAANRSDFTTYKIQELEADKSLETAYSNNRFNAEFTASVGYNQQSPQLPDAYKSLMDQEAVNLTFSIPIFQWGKGAAEIESALASQKSVQTTVSRDKQNFELNTKYQVLSFNQLQNQLTIAAKADTVAQRRFEVAKNRYMIGKIDLTAFFIAQNEKDNAFTSYIQTQRNFWTSYYRLRRLALYDFINDRPVEY